jgi:hypothetical protein
MTGVVFRYTGRDALAQAVAGAIDGECGAVVTA